MKNEPLTGPPGSIPRAAEAVLTFLQSVGRPSEAELYLRLFRQLPKESFAIIAVGSPVVRQSLGSLLEQLRFLSELGLVAPIVLGLLDPDRAEANTDRLVRRMPGAGLVPTVYDLDDPGSVAAVRDDLRRERNPVLFFRPEPGEPASDRFARLGELARALDTRKLVLLRRRGALGPQKEHQIELVRGFALPTQNGGISIINLRSDKELLLRHKLLRRDDAELLTRVDELLAGPVPPALLVSLTSPLDLLRELFTVRGAGTLIKRGTSIERTDRYDQLDLEQLRRLLEVSFGRQLEPGFFTRRPLAVYVAKDYRGAAIVEPSDSGPYLSKFAVDPVAQGEGMGQEIWQALTRDHAALFWRSRATNSISRWYATVCDGFVRSASWHVFWRGISADAIPRIVDEALSRPEDFAARP